MLEEPQKTYLLFPENQWEVKGKTEEINMMRNSIAKEKNIINMQALYRVEKLLSVLLPNSWHLSDY